MRRIPGIHRRRGGTVAVGMTEHRSALGTRRPVLAGPVLAGRECGTICLRSCQHVMAVRRIAQAVFYPAPFGHPRLLVDIVFAMQLHDIPCGCVTLCILPRPPSLPDAA